MKRLQFTAATMFILAGCDSLAPSAPSPTVAYRPEAAGTVDHAMCLLGFAATPLQRLRSGHQLVKGRLNGKPVTFVLDTGANLSVVSASSAKAFGLVPQFGVFGAAAGLGGTMKATRSSIESLQLGDLDIRQTHVIVADLSQVEAVLGRQTASPIHGIIGQDVMREHRAVIDVARPMLYMRAAGSLPAPVPADRCTAPDAQT